MTPGTPCSRCGQWITCTACGAWWKHPTCPRAETFAFECRACLIEADPFKPGDRIEVVPFERGPEGRWWTVSWYLGPDNDPDEPDMVLGEPEVWKTGDKEQLAYPVINRKAGGYETAAVPEGPFTVKRWIPRETWVEAAVRQHRKQLWWPVLRGDPVEPRPPRVTLVEAPLWFAEYGASWFVRAA